MSAARPSGRFATRRLVLRAGMASCAGVLPAAAQRPQPGKTGQSAQSAPPVRPLKVVIFNLVPFGMPDASGQPAGMTVDFQKQLAAESGLAMELQLVPYPRAIAMLVAGDADLLFSFSNPQLLEHARQLGVIGGAEIVVQGLAGSRFASAADLRGKRVGHIRGAQYDVQLQADPAVTRYETVSYEQTVRMLLEGRFEAALGVRLCLLYTLRQLGVPRHRLGPELVLRKGDLMAHYSNKRYNPQTAAALVRALAVLRERGTVAALFKAYEERFAQP